MNTPSSFIKNSCLIVAITLVPLPAVSLAGDTDPDGVKLMLLHEDPEFKAALKEKSGGAENSTDWAVVCTAELLTLVGAIIWEARRKQDHCARVTKSDWGAGDYCVTFSNECNHYQWDSNCLLDKRGEYYCDDH
jgi:hypothetical protein